MHAHRINGEERTATALAPRPNRLRAMFGARPRPPAALPDGLRLYAIGDVHGRLDLLERLLDAIRADHESRAPCAAIEVVLLGDLIDRGPDSAGVVRAAMNPPAWATFHALMGNHEHAMVEGLHGDRAMAKLWLANGGEQALASWGVAEDVLRDGTVGDVMTAALAAIPNDQLRWLGRRPLALRRGGYYFVHAGIRPGVALERQSARDALWIRDAFLSSERDHGVTVVHGHSIAAEVEERANRIGIDTGAHVTGRLTALALEGTQRWTLQT